MTVRPHTSSLKIVHCLYAAQLSVNWTNDYVGFFHGSAFPQHIFRPVRVAVRSSSHLWYDGLKKLESLGTMVKCALVLTHYQRVMDGHAACSQVTLYT